MTVATVRTDRMRSSDWRMTGKADFSGAASTYSQSLLVDPKQPELARRYPLRFPLRCPLFGVQGSFLR